MKDRKDVFMVCFIILHYKNLDDTLECVDSIQKNCTKNNYKIIIVDNGTASLEEQKVLKEHADQTIFNKTNLGFAKANNLGAKKAIEQYHPDYLAIINNDTLILQDDWIERIKKIDSNYHFDALGPDILTKDGFSVNPFPVYETEEQIKKAIHKAEQLNYIYRHPVLLPFLNLYLNRHHFFRKKQVPSCATIPCVDVALHGCAIIFSKKYYERYEDVFYNETFLYHEEEFLDLRRKRDHLIFVYDPSLTIFHKEEASLQNNFGKKIYERKIFRNKEIIRSLQLLLKEIEKGSDAYEK